MASSFFTFLDHTQAPQSVGFLWTGHPPDADDSDNTQHSQETNINADGGVRTRNPSKRSAALQQLDIRRNNIIVYSATLDSSVTQHIYLRPEMMLNPVLLENVVQFCIGREICSACLPDKLF